MTNFDALAASVVKAGGDGTLPRRFTFQKQHSTEMSPSAHFRRPMLRFSSSIQTQINVMTEKILPSLAKFQL